MTEGELLKLYERMDAHEHDHRDKILGRLQLAFAVITALATVQTYIVLRADLSQVGASLLAVAFLVVFLMALALLIAAGYYFVRALWNHNYECPLRHCRAAPRLYGSDGSRDQRRPSLRLHADHTGCFSRPHPRSLGARGRSPNRQPL